MKKLLLLILICSTGQAYGQKCKVLENADGNQKYVIYFASAGEYYPCGEPTAPRKKVAPGEKLLGECYCGNGDGPIPPISPAATAYSNIQFDFDSSVLRASSYPVLDAISADLRSSGKAVEVGGYASPEGTAAHNIALSKDRANSVKTYLVNSGVDAKRVKVKGFGETNPIADNSTEEGRVLNRRVQFKIQ